MQFELEKYNVTEGDSVSMTLNLLLDNVTNNNLTVTLQAINGTAVGESFYSSDHQDWSSFV